MRFDYFLWTINHFSMDDLSHAYQELKTDNDIRFWFKVSDEVPPTANTLDRDALFVFEKPSEIVLMGKAKLGNILQVASLVEFVESMEDEIRDFFKLPTTLKTQQALGTLSESGEACCANGQHAQRVESRSLSTSPLSAGCDIESIISNLTKHAKQEGKRLPKRIL